MLSTIVPSTKDQKTNLNSPAAQVDLPTALPTCSCCPLRGVKEDVDATHACKDCGKNLCSNCIPFHDFFSPQYKHRIVSLEAASLSTEPDASNRALYEVTRYFDNLIDLAKGRLSTLLEPLLALQKHHKELKKLTDL